MTFTKRLRDGVRRGEITCGVRIWTRPLLKVGGRYGRRKARSKWTPLSRSVFRTLHPNWRESRVSSGLSIYSRWPSTVEVGTFTSCAFIT
jgi:hypothetical protein